MFPIGDDNYGRRSFPIVNILLIAINVLVFVFLQGMDGSDKFTYAFSTVPQEIISGRDVVTEPQIVRDPATGQQFLIPGLEATPIGVYITLFVSMFMHGGWAHLLGNMWFLWIFGDNIEDYLGRFRYLIFYLVCGLLASLAHVISTIAFGQDPLIPSLGASGAISGVLGGYLLLFPQRRVRVLIMRFVTDVSAIVAIGLWFLFQIVNGIGLLGGMSDGVAYAAHVGGFFAGLVLVKVFALGKSSSYHD